MQYSLVICPTNFDEYSREDLIRLTIAPPLIFKTKEQCFAVAQEDAETYVQGDVKVKLEFKPETYEVGDGELIPCWDAACSDYHYRVYEIA